MVAIKNIILLAAGASAVAVPAPAAIEKRALSNILADISTINSGVVKLASQVNGYKGGQISALPIQQQAVSVGNYVTSAASDTKKTPKLTDAQASQVIAAVNSLIPNIQSAVNAVVSKKALFNAASLSGTVQTDFSTLKADSDSFAQALINIAPSDKSATASALKSKIDSIFISASSAYAK